MGGVLLLMTVTVLYAGYNVFIKVAGSHAPAEATTTIAATIALQLAALATSIVFVSILLVRGGHVLQLSASSYLWAVAAGLCIGGAEIAYFYLFAGIGTGKPMAASVAVPAVVSGTIAITAVVAMLVFKEILSLSQWTGTVLILLGVLLLSFGRGDSFG